MAGVAVGSPVMVDWGEPAGDVAGLVVPLAGRLVATGDRWEPYRLLDGAVWLWRRPGLFGHLQAAERSELTICPMAWIAPLVRFVWAAGVAWDQVTRGDWSGWCAAPGQWC